MKEKEEEINKQKTSIQQMIPELRLKQQLSKYKSEATIFKGIKGAQTAFEDILKTLKKGDEYSCRLVSFTRAQKYGKIEKSISKLRDIEGEIKEDKNASVDFLCGFLNKEQTVTVHSDRSPLRILVDRFYFQIQLLQGKQRFERNRGCAELFENEHALTFFNDLTRLYSP